MRINKSMEIAKFSLEQGVLLSAREMWERGFRYSRGETTPDNIGVVLGKIHESDRFVLERTVTCEGRARRCRVLVTEIKKPETQNRARNDMLPQQAERWRWLLSRRAAV